MHTTIWELFGDAIEAHHSETLAAYLGHRESLKALESDGVDGPTLSDFRGDRAFDPNPHGLDLPDDYCEMLLLVHSLAVWGPDVLIYAASACAELQMETQVPQRADLVSLRDAAFHAAKALIKKKPTDMHRNEVVRAAAACQAAYHPYADTPDCADARITWLHLGAPWFAAETAAQDFRLQQYDGPGPREASSTWCRRSAVWPQRAADAAAEWTSCQKVLAAIRRSLLDWMLTLESWPASTSVQVTSPGTRRQDDRGGIS